MLTYPLTTRALFLVRPEAEVWPQLQKIYARRDEDSRPVARARRSLYRNVLLSLFNGVRAAPEDRPPPFRGLLEYAHKAESFDGLESVFLTLARAARLEGDH